MLKTWLRRALVLGWIPTLIVVGGARWFDEPAATAQERTPIKVTRIYTGDDGQTHAEEYEVPLTTQRAATELSAPARVATARLRRTPPGDFLA
ncbi:MAG: hypothetical protein OXH75_17355, partial [Acidobacteria bacterium]|nr:hypothetical protein [Acidobacteriota bacterium]